MKNRFGVLGIGLILSGCAHQVAFQDANYEIGGSKHPHRVVVVIEKKTLLEKEVINSAMAGVVNEWEVQPGEMLKQVSDIEFPQMFDHYEFSSSYPSKETGKQVAIVELSLVKYEFADFHATITMRAVLSRFDEGKHILLDRTFSESGSTQGGKMFWGGAFSMKSAIRQSSIEAYRKMFKDLREELLKHL